MRNEDRHRGKIKDRSNNRGERRRGNARGGGNAKPKQIESVSAPLYSRWGFHDAQLSSRSLFTILPLRLSKKQLFSATVMALV